jgi:surface protein
MKLIEIDNNTLNNNLNLIHQENNNILENNNNNLNFGKEDNNDIINNINNNINLMDINQKNEDDDLASNYILAEININENNINKEIRILNSYEECSKKEIVLSNNLDYFNENEIKQCKILINEELIPFSYFHKFSETGQYMIRYVFKNLLTKTNFMFCDCNYIVNIDLTNFKSEKVINMCGMFMNCSSLTYINLSNLNTRNVRNMSYMFCNCNSLTNLDLKDFNTEKVENMEYMFNNCISLLNLNLFSFDIQNNTKLDNIFNGCKSLLKDNIIYKDQRIYQKLLEQNEVKPSSQPVQPEQYNHNQEMDDLQLTIKKLSILANAFNYISKNP